MTKPAGQQRRDTVAANLRQARQTRGLSQDRLARRIEQERTLISHWELGLAEPPPDLIEWLAQALDVPEDYFYSGRGLTGGRERRGAYEERGRRVAGGWLDLGRVLDRGAVARADWSLSCVDVLDAFEPS